MRNCYISRNYKDITSAGGKAKTDIEQIMKEMGFVNIGLSQTHYKNIVIDYFVTLAGIIKMIFCLKGGDTIVLQYPIKKYYKLLCNVAHLRKGRVVTVIHDLGSFRRKKLTAQKEIIRLNHSDIIIAHNESMKDWLISNGCKATINVLGIFDYLSPGNITAPIHLPLKDEYSIFYVGNLSYKKNKFIYSLGDNLKKSDFYLFGNGLDKESLNAKENIFYKGFVRDLDLITNCCGDFGLSWYGNSLDSGEGDFGEYMKYNNPHKISLYLRCNVPVIIWEKAGLAQFVKENGVGICVSSLNEIEQVLAAVSLEEYNKMLQNVHEISQKISSGYFMRQALRNL